MATQHDWLLIPGRVLTIFSSITKPKPKEKHVVLVATKPILLGFFINSPTDFQKIHHHLMAEMVELNKADGYPFITHRSYIDCTEAIDLEEEDLIAQVTADPSRDRKMITDNTRNKILGILENALMLEGGIAAIIKKNLSPSN